MKRIASLSLVLVTLFGPRAHSDTISKANNTDALNLSSSWVGGTAPGAADVAQWDNTVTSANTTVLGADLTWGGIVIATPGGPVTINAGNTLTLGNEAVDIDMSAAVQNLTLNCDVTLGGANAWSVAANRTLTVGGTLGGSDPLTKQGAGTLVLNGNNGAYSGAVSIAAGVLNIGHGSALGTANTAITAASGLGALYLSGGISAGNSLTINGAAVTGITAKGNLRSLSGNNTWSGTISGNASPRIGCDSGTLEITGGINLGTASARTPTFVGAGNIIVNSVVSNAGSGAGALDKRLGTGSLRLRAANTYKGATTLFTGTTILDYSDVASVLPDVTVLTLSGGTVQLEGGSEVELVASTTVGALVGGSPAAGASAVTRGSGTTTLRLNAITRNNGGTVNFVTSGLADTTTGNDNGILGGYATVGGTDWAMNSTGDTDGPITAYSAYQTATSPASWAATDNVSLAGDPSSPATTQTINSLRLAAAATVKIADSATLTLASGGLLVTGSGAATIEADSGTATLNGRASGDLIVHQHSSADLTISAAIADNGGATALTKSGPGRLVLTGDNTYTGLTFINQGVLSISSNGNLGDETVGAGITFAGGTLQVTGTFALDNGGASPRPIGLGETTTSTIEVTDENILTVSGVVSGRGWLNKTGVGSLVLTGATAYQGDTIVSQGTLLVNAPGSLAANTVVRVGAGGTLGGDGIIGSNTTIEDGGTLAPGDSPGTLTINGSLTLNGSSVLAYELNGANTTVGGGVNDLTEVGGPLLLDGVLNVTETTPGSFLSATAGNKWRLFNYADPVNFVNNGLTLGTMPALSAGLQFAVDTASPGEVNLAVVAAAGPPQPRIISVAGAGTPSVTVTWTNVVVGTNYLLQYNTNLNTTNWTGLAPVTASGATASQTDNPPAGDLERYYRVQVQ